MDALEQQLKSILDSPEEMRRITQMAQSLFGGGADKPETPAPEAPEAPEPEKTGLPDLSALLGRLGGGGLGRDKTALLDALAPYLGEKRRQKLRKAASLSRAARLAQTLLAQGGAGHV